MDARFRFDDFELDCAKRELRHLGSPIQLKSKTFDLLQHLVENHGKVVTKSELLDHVWPGQFVEENNLTVQVSALRKVFSATGVEPIRTVPGKGYTFVGNVYRPDEELIVESRSFSRVVIEESVAESNAAGDHTSYSSLRALRSAALGAAFTILVLASIGFVYWWTTSGAARRDYKLSSVSSTGDIASAAISPDGRYAVFARRSAQGESLWLRQIESGSEQRILDAKPLRYTGLTVSPDGDWIFATTFSPELPDPQLFRLPLIGGLPELIPNITTGSAVSISPDGSKLAYTESRSSMKQTQLLTSNIDGTGEKVIARGEDDRRSFPNFNTNPVSWSPDGRWLAVAVEERGESIKCGVLLVSPDTGEERMIGEERFKFLTDVAWIDDEHIAFTAFPPELTGPQIWSVSRRTGEFVRLTNDLAGFAGITSGRGGILGIRQSASSRLMAGDIDASSEKIDLKEVFAESRAIENIEFARDGSIIYSSSASGRRELWRLKNEGVGERITNGADIAFGLSASPVSDVIAFGAVDGGKYVIKTSNLDGKASRTLTEGPEDANPSFSSDGSSLLFQKGIYNRMVTAWRLGLDGTAPTQLTEKTSLRPIMSPDGTLFAYYFMDGNEGGIWKVGFASPSDGSLVGKREFPVAVTERRMQWLGNSSIFQILYAGEQVNLLKLATAGGQHQIIETNAKGDVQAFAISKDQKRIVFALAEPRSDIVLLSNK